MTLTEFFIHPALPLLTFLLGLLIGHWTALGRDKRKEFNQAAEPLRNFLVKDRANPSAYTRRPGIDELDAVLARLGRRDRLRFEAAWQGYQAACDQARSQDLTGQVFYKDTTAIVVSIDRCLALLRLR